VIALHNKYCVRRDALEPTGIQFAVSAEWFVPVTVRYVLWQRGFNRLNLLGAKIMSTKERMTGNWNQLKGKVKQRWGQLTDDELSEVEGNVDQLVGLIQQKTGDAREKIQQVVDELSESAGGAVVQATETARQYAGQASDALREAADQVRERSIETYEDAQDIFRRRPVESVAAAFGTGLLIGVIVGVVLGSRE